MVEPSSASSRFRRIAGLFEAMQRRLPGRQRLVMGVEHGVMSAAAALLAYLPAEALSLKQSFWGAITAIAVVQTEYAATRTTARDQFTGAAVGGAIGVAIVATTGQHLPSYAAAVLVSVASCWILNVAGAARLAGVTATIIMLVPHEGSPELMMVSRVAEVGWGVSVAIAVVWLVSRLTKQPRVAVERPSDR